MEAWPWCTRVVFMRFFRKVTKNIHLALIETAKPVRQSELLPLVYAAVLSKLMDGDLGRGILGKQDKVPRLLLATSCYHVWGDYRPAIRLMKPRRSGVKERPERGKWFLFIP